VNRRTFVVAALAWVFVVTLGSGLVWAVISNAGENVGADGIVASGSDSTPELGSATQAVGAPTYDPTHQRSHDAGDDRGGDHHGSGSDGPGDSDGQATGAGQPTSGPTGDHTDAPGSPGDPGGTKSGNPSPDDGPTPVTKIWSGDAGLVKVQCTGSTIELLSVVPSNGYRYEVGSSGPEQVEVELENTSTERKTKVESLCSHGTPTFRVETESESGTESGDD
jgi:hypothetical protein